MIRFTLDRRAFGALVATGLLLGSTALAAAETIKLGVIGGDEEEIAEVAKKVAEKNGLTIEIVAFSDYTLPNEALDRGDIDANAFQHKPYLDAQIAARGYRIVPAATPSSSPSASTRRGTRTSPPCPRARRSAYPTTRATADGRCTCSPPTASSSSRTARA